MSDADPYSDMCPSRDGRKLHNFIPQSGSRLWRDGVEIYSVTSVCQFCRCRIGEAHQSLSIR